MIARALESAKTELEEAIAYHRQQSDALAEQFKRAANRALEQVIDHPMTWPQIYRDYRRCLLKKFSYAIIYRVAVDELVIVAFMHLRRDPDYWKTRE